MSECMGLLSGTYDAKTGGGFQAGGMSLHNVMASHGPDANAHDRVLRLASQGLISRRPMRSWNRRRL